MRCNRLAGAVLLGALVSAGGGAWAFLDTGTLLTNAASAKYEAAGVAQSISYSATGKILVANPAIFLWKDNSPTCVTASAGGTIQFIICFSNGGANTGFNITIKDRLPPSTVFWSADWMWSTDTAPIASYSGGGSGWTVGNPPGGQGQPLYLQWVVQTLGIGKSGCIAFTISIG